MIHPPEVGRIVALNHFKEIKDNDKPEDLARLGAGQPHEGPKPTVAIISHTQIKETSCSEWTKIITKHVDKPRPIGTAV